MAGNANDVNGFADMFPEGAVPLPFHPVELLEANQLLPLIRQRIRMAPYITPASPFRQIREHTLFIIAPLANHPNAPNRDSIVRILNNVLVLHENPPGNAPSLILRNTIEILRHFSDHPEHPVRDTLIGLMHALFVRDNRLGLPPNDSMISRFVNIMHRLLFDPQLPNQTRGDILIILSRIFRPNIAADPQLYNDAFLMRLRYITMILVVVLNDGVILQQPNRAVQAQLVHRLFEMVANVNNAALFNEHFELLLLMVQLLVNPDGFNDVFQVRIGELMQQLQHDDEGQAFIEHFENILLEILAGDAPEPSTDSGESARTQEYIRQIQRRRLDHISQSSSGQTEERQLQRRRLEDTAQSNPRNGGNGKKPPAKPSGQAKAKPPAKQAKPPAKQAKPPAKKK